MEGVFLRMQSPIYNGLKVSTNQMRRKKIHGFLNHWQLYTLLIIPILYVFVFSYLPMYGIQIAFKQYNFSDGIWNSPWVGDKWFKMFFASFHFG